MGSKKKHKMNLNNKSILTFPLYYGHSRGWMYYCVLPSATIKSKKKTSPVLFVQENSSNLFLKGVFKKIYITRKTSIKYPKYNPNNPNS